MFLGYLNTCAAFTYDGMAWHGIHVFLSPAGFKAIILCLFADLILASFFYSKAYRAHVGAYTCVVTSQCLQKVFTLLDFGHILLCCSLNLRWIKLKKIVTDLHKIPHNDKVKTCF